MTWLVQVATWTSNNRYPGVFRTVQNRIRQTVGADLGSGRLRLLSFGCSSGNEIAALRSYFPEALIFGCDVNQQALGEARRALQFDDAQIFESSPENIAKFGPYDAIFAMSVFCRFPESQDPRLQDFRSLYAFDDFEDGIDRLAKCLTNDGILCIFNANYDFSQLSFAKKFRPIRSPLIGSNGFVDRFEQNGQRLTRCEMLGQHYVHRLHADRAIASNSDFLTCVYERRAQLDPGEDASRGDEMMCDLKPPDGRPDLFRFGPDLAYCSEQRLRATSLGYWFRENESGSHLTRAWFRTTFDGLVEQGSSWTVDIDPGTEELFRNNVSLGGESTAAGDAQSRSVVDRLRRLVHRTRDAGRRRLWGAKS